jgi:hypothetical protein
MLPLGCHLLQNSRLAVVFDLDETLVQSHSEATLKRVIDKVERTRWVTVGRSEGVLFWGGGWMAECHASAGRGLQGNSRVIDKVRRYRVG